MSVLTMHCSVCSSDFVDSRVELKDGDEAICPKCGARLELTQEFIQSVRRDLDGTSDAQGVVHTEPDERASSPITQRSVPSMLVRPSK